MNLVSGAQSLQPALPGSTWLSRHLLWHKVLKIFDINIKILFISMLELSTKIYPRNYCFLVLRRTGFNNIVPYNATRQGMPGYELPGVLRDPLMTVDPQKYLLHIFYVVFVKSFEHRDDSALLPGGSNGKV